VNNAYNLIGRLLLEAGQISKTDYAEAIRRAKETGRSFYEVLLSAGKVSIDDLVQAITIHMDIMLLKEALGFSGARSEAISSYGPTGSYLERISLLFKMGMSISGETDIRSLMDLLIREAPTVMNAERATIFLADYEAKELYSHLAVGLKDSQIRIPWDSGIAGWVFHQGKSLNIADVYNDPRFYKSVDSQTGFQTKNVLCVPLRTVNGPILGVFQVLNKRAGVFTAIDQEILEILASQAAKAIEQALEWDSLRKRALTPPPAVSETPGPSEQTTHLDDIVGATPSIEEVRGLIRKVARTDTTILIQGESGTGKELVARAIHHLSPRASGPMVSLNCAAVPSELIESELFGHKRGSFTGAINDHKGVFRAAHKGTLFLDEIEATSPAMQVKLLRAIQTGEIKPVGENVPHFVDVRLITAANRDLAVLIEQGNFREDLFYRINVFPIIVSPLRERADDVPVLVNHFLQRINSQTGKNVRTVDPAAMELLMRYPWPGNVRELENELERAHILIGEASQISVRCLSQRITRFFEQLEIDKDTNRPQDLKKAVDNLERSMLTEALQECKGNRTLAARRLGLSRQGLINKINKYNLSDIARNNN
jgi:transcriptional regulator with GAF, ATPase, and Fis domain